MMPSPTLAPALEWSDDLSLDVPQLDDTHREFVILLAQTTAADDAAVLAQWAQAIAHTDTHFAMENAWMAQTGFGEANCHTGEHSMILQVMREAERRAQAGNLPMVRQLASELGTWFAQHAQSMDLALAQHVTKLGFDPATGTIAHPEALPAQALTGCGSAG